MWTHSRRSHEHSHSESRQRSESPAMGITESHKRTSSDATPRPSASSSRFLNPSATDQESRSALSTEVFGSSKRLGYLADKISQSLSGTGNPQLKHNPSNSLLHPNSHSKAEPSNPTSSASQSSSPAPMASSSSLANAAKSHTSPSKVHIQSKHYFPLSALMSTLAVVLWPHIRLETSHEGDASLEPWPSAVWPRTAALNRALGLVPCPAHRSSRNVSSQRILNKH